MRELQRTALAREQQPRLEQLVEQRLDLGGRAAGDARQQLGVDHQPEHGGDRQQLVGLRAQPRQPRADRVPDALRHRGVVVGQPAQDLLDEERVAAGARVHGAGHAGGGLGAEPGGRELADLAGREPAQADPLGAAVAPQVRQRGGERRAAPDLRVAVGAEDEERRRPAAAQDEREQEQRRPVGPVQVVEDQHQRPPLGDAGQHVVDRREQPVPGARIVVRAAARAAEQAIELARARERARRRRPDVPQHVRERLERGERVLGAAAGQHDRVAGFAREPQREPRLADAGLAGQEQQPPGAAIANEAPRLAQPRQLAGAADEQLLALEHGGRSDRRRRAIRPGRAQAVFVLAPQLEHPLVVHPLQELAVAQGGGVVDAAGLEQGGGLAQVDPGAVERDGLARRDEADGLGPERPPQLAQRGPQAGASALVEHVRPEPGGQLAARVRAGVRGQVGEQRPGAARRRQRDLAAVRLERQAPGEAHPEHRGNPIPGGAVGERQLRRYGERGSRPRRSSVAPSPPNIGRQRRHGRSRRGPRAAVRGALASRISTRRRHGGPPRPASPPLTPPQLTFVCAAFTLGERCENGRRGDSRHDRAPDPRRPPDRRGRRPVGVRRLPAVDPARAARRGDQRLAARGLGLLPRAVRPGRRARRRRRPARRPVRERPAAVDRVARAGGRRRGHGARRGLADRDPRAHRR